MLSTIAPKTSHPPETGPLPAPSKTQNSTFQACQPLSSTKPQYGPAHQAIPIIKLRSGLPLLLTP